MPSEATSTLKPLSTQQQGEAVREPKKALERIKRGEGLRSLGKSLGLSQEGVRKWLFREVGPEYVEMQTDGLVERIVHADRLLEAARDPVDITRAREMARFARMDLERRRPHLYGQRTHVTVENVGDLADKLRRARERVIEHEPVADTPNGAVHTGLLTDSAAPEQ
jgi:hypothetical protein